MMTPSLILLGPCLRYKVQEDFLHSARLIYVCLMTADAPPGLGRRRVTTVLLCVMRVDLVFDRCRPRVGARIFLQADFLWSNHISSPQRCSHGLKHNIPRLETSSAPTPP